MAYYAAIFSPETYRMFSDSSRSVTGVAQNRREQASRLRPGDKLICYITRISRWIGVLEINSACFIDTTPLFAPENDPYCIRFQVKESVWLKPQQAVPMTESICWDHLSFTRNLTRGSSEWTVAVRRNLKLLSDEDGGYLEQMLIEQRDCPAVFPWTERDEKKMQPGWVNSGEGLISVSVPDDEADVDAPQEARDTHAGMQAMLAEIGERMNMRIWIPRADRASVLRLWTPASPNTLLSELPLNFDSVMMRIIESIDLLWIQNVAIRRAFEVEHTTSVYSGLLRMADLISLQPNLSIETHIVAEGRRRDKFIHEIRRPVFTMLEQGRMRSCCSFLSYESVKQVYDLPYLQHTRESILDEYAEYAEDTEG